MYITVVSQATRLTRFTRRTASLQSGPRLNSVTCFVYRILLVSDVVTLCVVTSVRDAFCESWYFGRDDANLPVAAGVKSIVCKYLFPI